MKFYSEKDLMRLIDYYEIPYHDDLKRVFSNREFFQNVLSNSALGENSDLIETVLFSINIKSEEQQIYANYDLGVVITKKSDRLYLKNDVDEADENMTDPPLRIIPFAEFYNNDLLCFFYENLESRPKIIIWKEDESDIDDAKYEFISDNLDRLISTIKG